ncbi:hypothetical protein SDC9_182112 [bioreactor metagenome]|uniref:Uncharacterized protein n=1 Tax=bioreactor metagenome TaxID=1076179 RepID=A0A645H6K5_9ZZZZ
MALVFFMNFFVDNLEDRKNKGVRITTTSVSLKLMANMVTTANRALIMLRKILMIVGEKRLPTELHSEIRA